MTGDLRPITVSPDAGEVIEVGSAVLRAVGIIPERDRHARERLRANELTRNQSHWATAVIENIDRHSQPRRLNLATVHRQNRIAEYETGDDVAAATDAGEMNVGFDLFVDVVEAAVGKGTSRRQNRFQSRELVRFPRFRAVFLQERQILGAGAEYGD